MIIEADLTQPPGTHWQPYVLEHSRIDAEHGRWRFVNEPIEAGTYSDAQIDDYHDAPGRQFEWRAPLTLTVRARFSHNAGELQGTAGFGFWNDPFMMSGTRTPALPRAIWFFYGSPASNMKLDINTPGWGWKAATIDAQRLPFFLLAPSAPLAIPLMNLKALYRTLWPIGQRAIGVSEALLDVDMTAWHCYTLEWGTERASFTVDDTVVLDSATPPRGTLGFVMWIDNQAMVVTPWGRFRWQTLPIRHEQWMEIDTLCIDADR